MLPQKRGMLGHAMKTSKHPLHPVRQVRRMQPEMEAALVANGRVEAFNCASDSWPDRNISPQTVHWKINHRPGNHPQAELGHFRKANRRLRRGNHPQEVSKSLDAIGQETQYAGLWLRSAKACKTVFTQDVEMAYFVSREGERPQNDSLGARQPNALRDFAHRGGA